MTKWPNSVDPQFLDANGVGGLNMAYGTVSGAVASIGSGAWALPGLLAPEAAGFSFSGNVATVTLPAPWGIISASGVVVRAHGTLTGQDTQTYSVNFSSLIPGSGSVTAYLAATVQQIQQNPFPVPGPPPGFPSYNPNYVPTVGYATNLYTVALAATTSAPNNVSSFELLRTTLTAGQGSVSSFSTIGWVLAADRKAWPQTSLASGGLLVPSQAQQMLYPAAAGLTSTLPLSTTAGGLEFGFFNPTTGAYTVAVSGTDAITGFGIGTALPSLSVPVSGSVNFYGDSAHSAWRIVSNSPGLVPHGMVEFTTPGTTTWTVPALVTNFMVYCTGGGGGGADCGTSQTNPALGNMSGGGGGAGGTAIFYGSNVPPGTTYTLVIGSGGVAQNNGTASTFSTFCTGAPGIGSVFTATANCPGGGGGGAVGGTVNLIGGQGSDGQNSGAQWTYAGNGGGSFWGGGGRAGFHLGGAGPAPGSGGGGAYDTQATNTAFTGGPGGNGIIVVVW